MNFNDDFNDAYNKQLRENVQKQQDRINELVDLENKRIDKKITGILNQIKLLPNEHKLLLFLFSMFGFYFTGTLLPSGTEEVLKKTIQFIGLFLFVYIYLYFLDQSDGDRLKQTEIRWRSLNPFPENLYMDYRFIDFFYENEYLREIHKKGYEQTIEITNDFCGLFLEYTKLYENRISKDSLTLSDKAVYKKLHNLANQAVQEWGTIIYGTNDNDSLDINDKQKDYLKYLFKSHLDEIKVKITSIGLSNQGITRVHTFE